ncbi:hypothetical protein C0993_008120, partial [Termitomyces sp. T159_Od127]
MVDFHALIAASHFPTDLNDMVTLEEAILTKYKAFATYGPNPLPFKTPHPIDLNKAPDNHSEALRCPDSDVWCAAMQREMDSLRKLGVFECAQLPP